MLIDRECNSVSGHKVRAPLYGRFRLRVQVHHSVAAPGQQMSCHDKVYRLRKRHTALVSFTSVPPRPLCEVSLGVSCFGGVGTTVFVGGLGCQVQ